MDPLPPSLEPWNSSVWATPGPSGPSIFPLDMALALPARSFSYELQRRLVKAALQNPFLESVQTLAEFTAGSVSKRSLPGAPLALRCVCAVNESVKVRLSEDKLKRTRISRETEQPRYVSCDLTAEIKPGRAQLRGSKNKYLPCPKRLLSRAVL